MELWVRSWFMIVNHLNHDLEMPCLNDWMKMKMKFVFVYI